MTTAYLYAHQNPHAPERANGLRFWGYPTRPAGPLVIVVHTTESVFDQIGADTGAEGVAAYQSRVERPSSYHRITDRDSTVVQLPDEAVAFGAAGVNSRGLHVSLAMRAADWADPVKARAALATLKRAAAVAAEWHLDYGIPVRRITGDQAKGGGTGIVGHGQTDPGRRSDPGAQFPWPLFLELVRQAVAQLVRQAAVPAPAPPALTVPEDDMAQLLLTDHKGEKNYLVTFAGKTGTAVEIDAAWSQLLQHTAGVPLTDDPAKVALVLARVKVQR